MLLVTLLVPMLLGVAHGSSLLSVGVRADSNLLPPHVECPEQGVAQNDLPCPGAPGDVPLPGKPGTRTLPLPGLKPDPLACPQNGEGKPELLGLHDITPVENFYVRSHGAVPQRAIDYNMSGWQLLVDGEVKRAHNFTMDDLRKFPVHSRQYVLECAGNGRHGYRPAFLKEGGPASGNQWTIGAAGNANFTGVLLKDVLQSLGLTADARYIAWYGEDHDCSGSPDVLISRGFDIAKALDDGTMLVWEMNGKPLHAFHGFPLRVFAPGYPGAAQGKWLRRIWVRNQTHDGPKMTGWAYRMPKYPLWPGSANTSLPPDQYDPPIETEIITKVRGVICRVARLNETAPVGAARGMIFFSRPKDPLPSQAILPPLLCPLLCPLIFPGHPEAKKAGGSHQLTSVLRCCFCTMQLGVRAMITNPSRCTVTSDRNVVVQGRAWSGAGNVTQVEVSYDHGSTWTDVDSLSEPVNKWAWQRLALVVDSFDKEEGREGGRRGRGGGGLAYSAS